MSQDARADFALLVADVYELAGSLRRHGEGFASSVGQTQARWQLLSVVSEGSWTVPQAARRLGVSRQAVQRVADDLEAEGLARYRPNPQHQRSALIELTAAGSDALAAIAAAADEWQSSIASELDRRALQRARATLRAVIDTIAVHDGLA